MTSPAPPPDPPAPTEGSSLQLQVVSRLSRLIAAPLTPEALASAALESLVISLRCDGGSISLVEDECLVEVATMPLPGMPPQLVRTPIAGSFHPQLLMARQPVVWGLELGFDRAVPYLEPYGNPRVASVGLRSGGVVVGILHLTHITVDWQEWELALLETVGATLGVGFDAAVRRTHVGEDPARYGKRLSVLHRITAATGARLELRAVLDACVDLTLELLAADTASVFLADEEAGLFRLAARRSTLAAPFIETLPLRQIIDNMRRNVPPPIQTSPPVIHDTDQLSEPYRTELTRAGVARTVSMLLVVDEAVVGLLSVAFADRRDLTPSTVELLNTMAEQQALAIAAAQHREVAQRHRQRLDAVMEHMPMPVAVLDHRGYFEAANAMFRQLSGPALGRHYSEVLGGIPIFDLDGNPLPLDALSTHRALHGEDPPPFEQRVLTPYGWRNLVAHVSRLADGGGGGSGAVLALQDVTGLRELGAARDRFLDIASHELRSPLASLKACTSLLQIDPRAEEPARRATLVQRIVNQVDRMVRLVDELVDLARIRGGTLHLTLAPMDLAELAREVGELLQLQSDRHAITVEAAEPVRGTWDRQRITQVLTNLLSNAIRYAPDGGPIRVTIEQRGDEARLLVEDRGVGLDSEQMQRLFEPYQHRGVHDGHAPTVRGGLGLGLHITHEIVEHHGGRIMVESQPGQGTRFTVCLPLGGTPAATNSTK